MKIVVSKKARAKGFLLVLVCLFSAGLIFMLGIAVGGSYSSVSATEMVAEQYEVRSRLLEDAMNRVGVCSVEDAVKVWADGLKTRSAALQHAMMSPALKGQYAAQLDQNFPNWVTGVSSPYVESYKIEKTENLGEDRRRVTISFALATSAGPAGNYKAVLQLGREGTFWRITAISADEGLYPYTGFKPAQ